MALSQKQEKKTASRKAGSIHPMSHVPCCCVTEAEGRQCLCCLLAGEEVKTSAPLGMEKQMGGEEVETGAHSRCFGIKGEKNGGSESRDSF